MHDVNLLKQLLDKKLYTRIAPYIKQFAVSVTTWDMMQALEKYYKSYPAVTTVNVDDFKTFFFMLTGKSLKEEKHTVYTQYFDQLAKIGATTEVLDDVLKSCITKDYAAQIYNTAFNVFMDKGATIDDISTMVIAHNREVGRVISKADLFASTDLATIVKACSTKGFEWRLEELNMSLGPIRKGDFIIVAAQPEVGKTTLMASEVSHMIGQLEDDRPILWINNEEGSNKVMRRVMQSYFGIDQATMNANITYYQGAFNKVCKGRLLITSDDNMDLSNVKKLTALFEEYDPALIVFDQLDKIEGFEKREREDLRLGSIYEWARNLAKKYCPVIAVSQASDGAENYTYVPQNMLRGSRTDKVGEADAIVTIGKSKEVGKETTRYINVPKNKLDGGPRSLEVHRHGKFEVSIKGHLARYEGMF